MSHNTGEVQNTDNNFVYGKMLFLLILASKIVMCISYIYSSLIVVFLSHLNSSPTLKNVSAKDEMRRHI